jgi:uncharacterized membrane protein
MSRPALPTRWYAWATVASAFAAAVVSIYLAVVSSRLQATPIGCGAGSGCATVLGSRWSNVAGLPVGVLAAAAYLAVAFTAFLGRNHGGRSFSLWASGLAGTVLTAISYFIVLQAVVIQAICPWCMADHVLGLIASFGLLALARRHEREPTPITGRSRRLAVTGLIIGAGIAMAFMVLQSFTARSPAVARLKTTGTADETINTLTLSLQRGPVTLRLVDFPTLGSPSASRRLVMLFDYCCPHCREAHAVIRRQQPRATEWQIFFLPTPLDAKCNPTIEETEPRFEQSCELARLSLAVWKVKPADWPHFDAWLFEPDLPRPAREAREHAVALYGEPAITEALEAVSEGEAIPRAVQAYQSSAARVLPIILSPGTPGIAGRTETPDELERILEQEFGYPAATVMDDPKRPQNP